jgi:hypothetical protein
MTAELSKKGWPKIGLTTGPMQPGNSFAEPQRNGVDTLEGK